MAKHCRMCGGKLLGEEFPKTCDSCGMQAFDNPTPVGVAVVFAKNGKDETGVLILRRKIAPGLGRWALPGGYIEGKEDAEDAASRELMEETGYEVNMLCFNLSHSFNTGFGQLLLFSIADSQAYIEHHEIEAFQETEEAFEVAVVTADNLKDFDICFSSHEEAIRLALKMPMVDPIK